MRIAVAGGGPAGLRAAEVAALAGAQVTLFDAKASVGRKFLVAGRGGLNLSKDEAPGLFASRYEGNTAWWQTAIEEFGPSEIRKWAASLGIETFAASTGRIYPREMKAAPLLRRWVHRLKEFGVVFAMHHRWTGLRRTDELLLAFDTPDGPVEIAADAAILAFGGGSWPDTGSNGEWVPALAQLGLAVSPLAPANCGWEAPWPAELIHAAEGLPLKNITVRANGREASGELLITRYGLEGGAIYQIGAALRAMSDPSIKIDLKPGQSITRLIEKMGPAKRHLLTEARNRWKLPAPAVAILEHHPDRPCWTTPESLAHAVKSLPITLTRPRPITEAISSAGGVSWHELDDNLMLRRHPGIFLAGEMIDWEAPTGGYLIQGCFATASRAAQAASTFDPRPKL